MVASLIGSFVDLLLRGLIGGLAGSFVGASVVVAADRMELLVVRVELMVKYRIRIVCRRLAGLNSMQYVEGLGRRSFHHADIGSTSTCTCKLHQWKKKQAISSIRIECVYELLLLSMNVVGIKAIEKWRYLYQQDISIIVYA